MTIKAAAFLYGARSLGPWCPKPSVFGVISITQFTDDKVERLICQMSPMGLQLIVSQSLNSAGYRSLCFPDPVP